MNIGVNWAAVWKPVWKAVWTNVPPIPPTPTTRDVPGFDFTYSDAKTPKWWEKSGQREEVEEPVQAEKPKNRQPTKARKEAERVIREVAQDQIERGDVPQSVRFAEVRSQLKALGPEASAFNWPALYERLHSQLLTQAIGRELAQEDRNQDDAMALLLLLEA